MEFQYHEDPEDDDSNRRFETPTTRRVVSRLPLLHLDGDDSRPENSLTGEDENIDLEETKRSYKRDTSVRCPPTVLLAPRKRPHTITNSKPLTSSVLLPHNLSGGGIVRTLQFKPSPSTSSTSLSNIFDQRCDR